MNARPPSGRDHWLSRRGRGVRRLLRSLAYQWVKWAVVLDLALATGLYLGVYTAAGRLDPLGPPPPVVGWVGLIAVLAALLGFLAVRSHLAGEGGYEDLRSAGRPPLRWWHRPFLRGPCTAVVLFATAVGVTAAGFGFGSWSEALRSSLLQATAPLPPAERAVRWLGTPPDPHWPGWLSWVVTSVYTGVAFALVAAWFEREKQRANYARSLFTDTDRPAAAYGTRGAASEPAEREPHEVVLLDKGERMAAAALPFLWVELSAADWSPARVRPDRCRGAVAALDRIFGGDPGDGGRGRTADACRECSRRIWADQPAAADRLTGWLLAHLGRLVELDQPGHDHRLAEGVTATAAVLAGTLALTARPKGRAGAYRDAGRLAEFRRLLRAVFALAASRPPLLLAACEAAERLGEADDLGVLDAQTRRLDVAAGYTIAQTDRILQARDRVLATAEQEERRAGEARRKALECGLVELRVPDGQPSRFRRPKDGREMVLVSAGSFARGDRHDDTCGPQRRVHLHSYLIDAEPVPRAAFERWVAEGGAVVRLERGFYPVQDQPDAAAALAHAGYVTWFAARAYAGWAVGGGDLPTEAQWEKAVRGAADARRYPPGDAWVDEARSPFGLAACGLVEWTRDAYRPQAYSENPILFDPLVEPPAGGDDALRVVRGRTPDTPPGGYHLTDRLGWDPLTAAFDNPVGFRVVLPLGGEGRT